MVLLPGTSIYSPMSNQPSTPRRLVSPSSKSTLIIVRKAVLGMVAAHRFQDRNGTSDPEKQRLAKEVQDCKDEAELVSPVYSALLPGLGLTAVGRRPAGPRCLDIETCGFHMVSYWFYIETFDVYHCLCRHSLKCTLKVDASCKIFLSDGGRK